MNILMSLYSGKLENGWRWTNWRLMAIPANAWKHTNRKMSLRSHGEVNTMTCAVYLIVISCQIPVNKWSPTDGEHASLERWRWSWFSRRWRKIAFLAAWKEGVCWHRLHFSELYTPWRKQQCRILDHYWDSMFLWESNDGADMLKHDWKHC